MANRPAHINIMVKAVMASAKSLVRDFGELENLQVSKKGPKDFVTAADVRSEETLKYHLGEAYPDYGFLAEEGGDEIDGKESYWIIDPLDGTLNFMHGFPHFAINVALYQKGEIVAGVTYDPILDELFWATKGQGLFLSQPRSDRRLRVANRRKLEESILIKGHHITPERRSELMGRIQSLQSEMAGIRQTGSSALNLAYFAAGRFDGLWLEGQSKWDIAPGLLFAKEAGAIVTDMNGKFDMFESGSIVAANDTIHHKMMKIIKG